MPWWIFCGGCCVVRASEPGREAAAYFAGFHVLTAFLCLSGAFYLRRKTAEKTGLTPGMDAFLWGLPPVGYFIGYLLSFGAAYAASQLFFFAGLRCKITYV